ELILTNVLELLDLRVNYISQCTGSTALEIRLTIPAHFEAWQLDHSLVFGNDLGSSEFRPYESPVSEHA
ncbi:hypothetical protein HAX54_010497, partial [Datura stramonium]|nr:hypothetical protein [Datura stramonium]